MDDMPDRVNLNMLISEYQASLKQGNKLAMRMDTAAAGAFLLLTLLSVAIFQGRNDLNIAVAWFAPLAFLIIFGALIGLATLQVAAAWQRRILAIQLRRLGGEEPVPSPAQDPLNLWRTSWKVRLLVGVPTAAFTVIFLLVAAYCLRTVYAYSHIHGLSFLLVYLGLVLVEILALAALYTDLPAQYHAALHAAASGRDLPSPRLLSPWPILLRWIVPFPDEMLNLSRAFWVGFLSPLLLTALSVSQLSILNQLFRQKLDWPSAADVPFLAVFGLGILVFFVTAFLLQQGIAIGRALQARAASGLPAPLSRDAVAAPVSQVVVRILAALGLGYLLAGRGYLLLLLVISIYQIIDLLFIERIRARQPFLGLVWQAASLPLYFAAGVLVWGGPTWDFTPYIFLAVIVFFLSLAMAAAEKRRQARALEAQGQLYDDYFMQRGWFWRQVGLWAAFLGAAFLFTIQAFAERCAFSGSSLLAVGYAVCKAGRVSYSLVGWQNSLLAGLVALVFLFELATLMVGLLGPRLALFRQITRRARALASPLLYLVALAAVIVGVVEPRAGWALGGIALGLLGLVIAPEI